MSHIRVRGFLGPGEERLRLGLLVRRTFDGTVASLGVLARGSILYRYGPTPLRAQGWRGEWGYFSQDRLATSEEVLTRLGVLAVEARGPAGRRRRSGGRPGGLGAASMLPLAGDTGWWRAHFLAREDLPVWHGTAMASGEQGRQRPGRTPRSRSRRLPAAGGSQVLVHRTLRDRLLLLHFEPLPRAERRRRANRR
jgi:hypothetical protein